VRCPHCRRHNRSGHPTCAHCGRALTIACGTCGQTNAALSRFCARCGRPVQAINSELKYVTVLFADIKNSTALISGIDPEEAYERMGPIVEAMRDAVRRQAGSVNRIAGDGLMALFGAPLSREDHAVCACRAAQEIVETVESKSRGEIAVRVGLHSGSVLLRAIENDFSTDYDAIGDTPHLAHRMESMAGENQIYLTAATFRLAQGFVRAEALGERDVVGVPTPVGVYRLIDADAEQDRWQARAARGLTTYLGRLEESELLCRELALAEAGDFRKVEIIGDPGLGKSRMTHELCRLAQSRGWSVWTAAAQPSDPLNSYRPLARLLWAWMGIDIPGNAADVDPVLSQAARELWPDATRVSLAPFASILALEVRDPHWKAIDPPERRGKLIDLMADLFNSTARKAPLLVLLEDLHWADEETLGTLERVIEKVQGSVLLVATRRPTLANRWEVKRGAHIDLAPLSRDASLQILDTLLGNAPELQELKLTLAERAGGNPLFLEESVESLVDSHVLGGESGAYELVRSVDTHVVPASLYGVVSTRIDRLDPAIKRSIQLASVIGRRVRLSLLEQLSEQTPDRMREHLILLDRLGLLRARELDGGTAISQAQRGSRPSGTSGDSDAVCEFKHALIQEVVYHSLPRRDRERIHAQIVRIIEELHSPRLEPHLDELADHALRGKLWNEAARYRLQICIRAQEQAATHEVVGMLDEVMASFSAMPQERPILKASVDLRMVIANALLPLGQHARIVEVLTEAEHTAQQIQDPRRLGTIYNQQSLALWLTGRYESMARTSSEALRLAEAIGHSEIGLSARFMAAASQHALGEYESAARSLDGVLQGFAGDREGRRVGWSGYPSLMARTFLIDALLQLGRVEEAGGHAEYGWRLGDQLGHPYSKALIRSSVVLWLLAEGRNKEATELCEDTRELCEKYDIRTMHAIIAARLAETHVRSGRLEAALEVLAPALQEKVYLRGAMWTQVDLFRVAAEASLLRRDLEEACSLADHAEKLCRTSHARGQLAQVLEVSARLEQALEHRLRALDVASEAMEIAQDLGMIGVLERVRGVHAELS